MKVKTETEHGKRKTENGKPSLSIIQAMELAISHELEARRSYLSLARETDDKELQQLLREIAQEEAHHEATLRSRLRLYQEKHLLRDTISRYVSPEMCEEILKNPDLLQLGGRRQEVTVLFADIRGFTALSESLAPEEVVEILNTYFTDMVDLVFRHQGTLDKFVGDALMAVFGVPLPLAHAPGRAVECALAMQRHVGRLKRAGRTPIEGIRIGVNTGEAIVGNIGSDKRMDFTVIGDAVNVAARLQEIAKELEAEIIISQATADRLERGFHLQAAEPVTLRGRKEPTHLYRLLP